MGLVKRGMLAIFLFFIIIGLSSAYVGLSPPRYNIGFEPGKEHIFVFDFITDENNELEVYVEGDLAKYVELSTNRIQGSERVGVLLELPNKIDIPGEHVIYVGARQISGENQGIQILANVKGTIRVFVPYPGKYAIMSIDVLDVKSGELVDAKITVNSQGLEAININGKVDVLDQYGKNVVSQSVSDWNIGPGTGDVKSFVFETKDIKPGRYKLVADLEYEGGDLKGDKLFRIGELFVDITSYTKTLIKNKLNKFEITTESHWNDPIENVYANVSIIDYPISFSTPSSRIDGFGIVNLSGYFDTSIIGEDKVNAKIIVNYQGKTSEKIVKLRFKGTINYLIVGLISVLILAIVAVIILVMWIKRLQNIKNERERKFKKK